MNTNGLIFSPPPAPLKGIVKGFWMNVGSGSITTPQVINIIACSGFGIIAPFKGDFFHEDKTGILRKYPQSFFVGIRTKNANLTIYGDYGLFGIVFYPQIFHHLNLTSPKDLINNNASVSDVLGVQGSNFEEELFLAKSFNEKVEIASKYLIAHFKTLNVITNKFDLIINEIHGDFYDKKVEDLAVMCNMSVRHFNRKFKDVMGINPKKYNRIIRFRKAIDYIKKNDINQNLTAVAYSFSYSDQGHFIKEFTEFAGTTPFKYFNKSVLDNGNSLMEDITRKYHH